MNSIHGVFKALQKEGIVLTWGEDFASQQFFYTDYKGEKHRITRDAIEDASSAIDWARKLFQSYINHISPHKDTDEILKLADTRHEIAGRVKEINAELDILRGITKTPKGYNIDPARAKELMAELKKLTKGDEK